MAITDINLSGKVRQDDGDGVSGATTTIHETAANLSGSQEGSSVTTDSNGTWSVTETTLTENYDVKITSGTSIRYISWADEIALKTVDTSVLKVRGASNTADAPIYLFADLATDAGDGWRIQATDSDTLAIGSNKASANAIIDYITITNGANAAASNTTILGQLTIGVDDTGADVKFFGATAGKYWLWDESADGVVQIGTLTVGVDDAGHDVKFFGDTASAYMLWDTSADDLVLAGAAGIDLAGDIDVDGTANLDVVDIDGAVQIDATFTSGVDGQGYDTKFFGDTSGAYILWDTSADKLLTAGGAVVDIVKDKFLIGGTAVTTTAAELNVLDAVTAGTVTASLGVVVDSSKDIGSFRNITLTGELDGGSLDISGNADIDGTTNLDAVDIDGNVQIDGTVTVGVDDTGLDVKFFGATSGQYLLWDESADELVLAGDTKLSFHDAAGGENIIASSNGHLEVNAGTTLDITAPTVDLNSSTEFNIDTAAYDLNASGAVTIDSAGISLDSSAASNLTTSGGALTITSAAAATWSTAASALTINGTGGLNLQEGGATIVSISDARVLATSNTASVDLDASGAIQINSSGGAISIGNDNIDQTVNLATAGTRTLNIGIDDATDLTTINVNGNMIMKGVTPVLTIGDAGDAEGAQEDAAIVFDGYAIDYHFGLDDTHDGMFLGSTSTIGSNNAQAWRIHANGPLIAFGSTPSSSYPFKVYQSHARTENAGNLQWFSSTMTLTGDAGSGTHTGMHIDNTLVMNDDDAELANVYQLRVDGAQITQPTPPADPGTISGNTAAIYIPSAYSGTVGGTNYALLIAGGLSSFGGDINVTGSRVSHIYATNITSTNSVTVDSWSKAKENIISYTADALAKINDIDVVTYAHQKWLDPTGRTKLGVRAESIGEPLVTPESDYGELGLGPAVDSMGLSALTVRAIQMLTDRIEELETRLATV